MNSHDINRHAEPLSPEERALGERLARLGPHGEPSPALDARILAAAHAAASTTVQAHRPSRRWPMALGIAASLTLAVGIAWQLRPVQEAVVYDEAASATAAQAEAAAAPEESAMSAVAVQPPPAADASTAQAPAAGSRRESDKVPAAPRPTAHAERARAPAPVAPAPPEPVVVFDEPAPADAAMPAPPAPPAAAVMRAPSPAPAAKTIGETRTQAAERNRAEAAASTAAGTAARAATQSREDAFAEDVPPATADSPEVREAWLQRIRELAKAGDTDDARASLYEFVHRYPNHPLPDDLRALLE